MVADSRHKAGGNKIPHKPGDSTLGSQRALREEEEGRRSSAHSGHVTSHEEVSPAHAPTTEESKASHKLAGARSSGSWPKGHSRIGSLWNIITARVVLQNLFLCVIFFYTVYYVVLGINDLLFKVYDLNVLAPFDFRTNPSWLNTNYKVLLVSMEITCVVCELLFILVVEEWAWDYAISVTIVHAAITSTVMLEFSLTSHWWAALGMYI
ncbi:transmembrane protein 244 [Manis pentadactyla]|uniref:transmembrane protein 244 n=1 Tax=Manis pentadactyla TaxID=143292 RepID=UPI00255C99BA|nr:transmembrane protein 244 [Manis pentadactyla]